jgi:hypothetical protein
MKFRGSIVVSIPACHAGDPGSIPGLGVIFLIRSVIERVQQKRCRFYRDLNPDYKDQNLGC